MTKTSSDGLLELRASELRPGDRVTFGDHTGWLKVRSVRSGGVSNAFVRIDAWPRWWDRRVEWQPYRVVAADETAWVKR